MNGTQESSMDASYASYASYASSLWMHSMRADRTPRGASR